MTHRSKPEYSREALLDWVRCNAPDLRIAHSRIDGKRESYARFSWAGETYEVEAGGENQDEDLIRIVAEVLREAMGLPPLFGCDERSDLERQIVIASLSDDDAQVKVLTSRLVALHAQKPRRLHAQTRIHKREFW